MTSEYQVSLKDLVSQSRKKFPQIEKTCNVINKSHKSDDIDRLLQLIVESHNKQMLLIGLRFIQSLMMPTSSNKQLPEIEMESLMAYFDAICRTQDEEINLKLIQLLPKLITEQRISALVFQKMLGYFLKFLAGKSPLIQAACLNCLEHLFRVYFSCKRQDSEIIVTHLFSYLSTPGNQKVVQDTVMQLLLGVDIVLPEPSIVRLINIFSQNFSFVREENRLTFSFELVKRYPAYPEITKVLSMIQTCFLSIVNNITPLNITIVSLIDEMWFDNLGMLQTMFFKNRPAFQVALKICSFIQENLGMIGDMKGKNQSVPAYLVSIYDLVLKVRQLIDGYTNASLLISNMQNFRPVKPDTLPKQKMELVQSILSNIGLTLSKIMVYLCKWGDYQRFKKIIYEQEVWVTICGIFGFHKQLNIFLKSLVYSTVPRKAQKKELTYKSLKASQIVLGLFHRKVFLLDLEAVILILKVIQAIQVYFKRDVFQIQKPQGLALEAQKDIETQYRLMRQTIRNLFHNSHQIHPALMGMFIQGLTQVALDTFTKMNEPSTQYLNPEFKVFALKKMYTIVSKNIGRIDQFWSLVLNFFIIHIGHKDHEISQHGLEFSFKILTDIMKFERKKSSNPHLIRIYESIKSILISCQKNEDVVIALAANFHALLCEHPTFIPNDLKHIFELLNCLLDTKIWAPQLNKTIEKCLDICMQEMDNESSLPFILQFGQLVIKMTQHKSHEFNCGSFHEWKFFGGLVNKMHIMSKSSPNDKQCDSDQEASDKIIPYIARSSSQKQISIQNSEVWIHKYGELMNMVIDSFKRSKYPDKCHYLDLFNWSFLSNVKELSYICIQNIIIPTFNKIFVFICDNCLASDSTGLTPHFSGTQLLENVEQQNWRQLLCCFVSKVYVKIIEIVVSTYQNEKNKTKFKPGESIFRALFLSINNVFVKRSYYICTTILPIYCSALADMPELAASISSQHLNSLLPNMLSIMTYIDQCDHIIDEQLLLLAEIQRWIKSTAFLIDKYPQKLQQQYLELILKIVGIYTSKKLQGLQEDSLKAVRNVDKKIIKSQKGILVPQELKTEFDKIEFVTRVSEKVESSKTIQDTSSGSTLSHIQDPVELYKMILEMQPKMSQGPLQFLHETNNLTFDSPDEEAQFIFKILPLVISSSESGTDFYRTQFQYIAAYLTEHKNHRMVIQNLNGVYTVKKLKELYLLIGKLIGSFLAQITEHPETIEDSSSLISVIKILQQLKPPEDDNQGLRDEGLIIEFYPILLRCLQINKPEATTEIVKCLSQLTKLLPN